MKFLTANWMFFIFFYIMTMACLYVAYFEELPQWMTTVMFIGAGLSLILKIMAGWAIFRG